MDLMTKTEFEQLVAEGEGTRVSLFAPTHRVSGTREHEQDRLRWKNLLTATEAALAEDGHDRKAIEELLAPAWELHDDGLAWSHMAHGLAMYLAPGWQATYRVPLDVPELATIGTTFAIGPVLPLLSDQNYVVLTLSQKDVRVLRGSRDRIVELQSPAVPRAFDDVFETSGPQSDVVPRLNTSGRRAQTNAVYYGASSLDNVRKEAVVEFFREVSRGVESHLAGRTIPMVLAGLPESVATYRELNGYGHVVEGAIERNPDDLSADDLREAAWELVAARLGQEVPRLVDRLHEQRARGTGALGVEETLRAAQEGRVDTLLVAAGGCWPSADGAPAVVRLTAAEDDTCALVDAAARATLRAGGAIRLLDELPESAPVAAVLRY